MLDKLPGIYLITNTATKKYYIGQSICIANRWKTHKCSLSNNRHHNESMQNDWNTYTEDSFTVSSLFVVTNPQNVLPTDLSILLTEQETGYIKKYIAEGKSLYNRVLDPGKSYWPQSKESIQKRCGEGNWSAKLTEAQAITLLTTDSKLSIPDAANKYNVTTDCIKDLWYRRSWSYLPYPKVYQTNYVQLDEPSKLLLLEELKNQIICNEDLCEKYNISMTTLQVLKRKHGLTTRHGKVLKPRTTPGSNKGKRLTYAQGELNNKAKLTEEKVLDILTRLANKETCASIGRLYHVSLQNISNIRDGKVWKHVSEKFNNK